MQEILGKMRTKITPNTGSFYVVNFIYFPVEEIFWGHTFPQSFEQIAQNSVETVRFHKISTPRN